jgi:hypothetical protein
VYKLKEEYVLINFIKLWNVGISTNQAAVQLTKKSDTLQQ